MQSIRQKIEILAKANGHKTLEAFAISIGYNRSHYSRLLGGEMLSGKALAKTAAGLGLKTDNLLHILQQPDAIRIQTDGSAVNNPKYQDQEDVIRQRELEIEVLKEEVEALRQRLVQEMHLGKIVMTERQMEEMEALRIALQQKQKP